MRVHIYYRTETAQEDLRSRIESLWNQAIEQGYSIAETYTDNGFSGATMDRPALNRLLADARNGEVESVLLSNAGHISSNPETRHSIEQELTELGVKIQIVNFVPKSRLYC